MLGNFSFGDYFKSEAIPFAWELLTEVLGIDADRLWVTVHETRRRGRADLARRGGGPGQRIQRLGEDNFWKMGDTGPCGPSSRDLLRQGSRLRAEDGGPAYGGSERFVEIWNLVFMQYNRHQDGTADDLPRPSIDTGAGLERILPVLQGVDSIFDTDLFAPMIEAAESITGRTYGEDEAADVGLRILADHGRAMSMLVADGVLPSNEGRGYVLRRVIRRAVRRARQLGVDEPGHPPAGRCRRRRAGCRLSGPGRAARAHRRRGGSRGGRVPPHAGHRARPSSRRQLAAGAGRVSGDVAFRLHDTYGFPVELTMEIAEEAGVGVDLEGFEAAMERPAQPGPGRGPRRAGSWPARRPTARCSTPRARPSSSGQRPDGYSAPARVVAVLADRDPEHAGQAEVFLDRTPFYAEGGGQVGDIGTIVTETGHRLRLRHGGRPARAHLAPGPRDRRALPRPGRPGHHRRCRAATPCAATTPAPTSCTPSLRRVLGDHVRQQGSLVAPDHLRFDFSHTGRLAPEELAEVAELANADVLTDDDVIVVETTKAEAEAMGALAFFGDKYGERVRVVRAGPHSIELCGGTHVGALGHDRADHRGVRVRPSARTRGGSRR